MITKLIGAATLFAAGSLVAGGPATIGVTPVEAFGNEATLTMAGSCGSGEKDAKDAGKASEKAKAGKAKDGSCGKGSCGKDMKHKKEKKDGACGKDKKEASCGKDKK
jgi:hypothetical protein